MREDELHVGMRVAVVPSGGRGIVIEKNKVEDVVTAVVAPDVEVGCTCGCHECCYPVYWVCRLDELRPIRRRRRSGRRRTRTPRPAPAP